jgi:hypothetical protein
MIIPRYVIVDNKNRILGGKNDIKKAKEFISGTDNRIFDMNKSEYVEVKEK